MTGLVERFPQNNFLTGIGFAVSHEKKDGSRKTGKQTRILHQLRYSKYIFLIEVIGSLPRRALLIACN